MTVLLGVLLLFVVTLAVGCTLTAPVPGHSQPTTGSTTTSTGSAGDIDVQQTCCVESGQGPFNGPDYFLIRTEGDPKDQAQTCEQLGLEPGFTAYAEPIVPPSTCPACKCSSAACKLIEEMHASAAKCPGNGAASTDFSALPGWEGTCDDSASIPADLQCNGVPCVESVTVSALTIDPCHPAQDGEPEIPAIAWGTSARECLLEDASGGGCGANKVCVRSVPPGYSVCQWAHGLHDCNDPEYPRRIVVYDDVKDDRACSTCACGDPQGAECVALITLYSDGACSSLAGAVKVAPDQPACVDVLSGSALSSKGAFFVSDTPGVCASSGGELTGGVALGDPLTLCCQPEPSLPG